MWQWVSELYTKQQNVRLVQTGKQCRQQIKSGQNDEVSTG